MSNGRSASDHDFPPVALTSPVDPSPVERIKAESRHLRGRLHESLADQTTGAIHPDDTQLIKFHGSYQQDDRDVREDRRRRKLEPDYSFMLRTRLPGGRCTPAQWGLLDTLCRTLANGTLRLTTRQAFQLHGVLKADLKPVMQGLVGGLLDTFAACGDVNRNVMAHANPATPAQKQAHALAVALSEALLPQTRAYAEVWLDEKPLDDVGLKEEHEPVYGALYLPRKFKIAVAVPPSNDVDVYAHDLSFVAILDNANARVLGYNILVGGGMGATHGEVKTYPRAASVIGFLATPDDATSKESPAVTLAKHVVGIQRDWGDRTNRKHARLKYTIDDRGLDAFVAELVKRSGLVLEPARPFTFDTNADRFGWSTASSDDGDTSVHHVTLHIESGRLKDRQLDGLREIARALEVRGDGAFILTPNQNLIIADLSTGSRGVVERLLGGYGLDGFARHAPVKRNALACVALPTCALAMAEAERALPALTDAIAGLCQSHGVADLDLHFRVTGCPNGCARPYLAEVALVGKGPHHYNLHLGGNPQGTALNTLYRENIRDDDALALLDTLLGDFVRTRQEGEAFGPWSRRTLLAGPTI